MRSQRTRRTPRIRGTGRTGDVLARIAWSVSVVSLVSFVSIVVPHAAQQAPTTQPAQGVPTFRTSTRLIVQTVTVKDKDGNPVEGLTAKDFIVTEDGQRQEISFVEFQRIESTPADASPLPAAPPAAPIAPATPAAASVPSTTPNQIAASQPGDIRYRNRRLVVLYFDLSAMPPP